MNVHIIDIDKIGHQILGELKEPLYQNLRKKIADNFGKTLLTDEGFINRKELGKIVFNSSERLEQFNTFIYKPLLLKLRRELYGKKGLILLDTALISESKMNYLSNNNIILVEADDKVQRNRLIERSYTDLQIKNRMDSQYTNELKKKMIEKNIEHDCHGYLWNIENSSGDIEGSIKKLFKDIINYLGMKNDVGR